MDIWYVGLVALAAGTVTVALLTAPVGDRLLGVLIAVPLLVFLASLLFATWYELRDEYLYVRSGPFVERIPYDRIRTLRLCENLWSSMALSRRRLEIRQHGRGWITGTTYVSPADRKSFLKEVKDRCTNLVTDIV